VPSRPPPSGGRGGVPRRPPGDRSRFPVCGDGMPTAVERRGGPGWVVVAVEQAQLLGGDPGRGDLAVGSPQSRPRSSRVHDVSLWWSWPRRRTRRMP
jgi:hypothetical protein